MLPLRGMMIDTLKVARRLREAGFSDPQAEAVVSAVQEAAANADLVTKTDLAESQAATTNALAELHTAFKDDLAELRAEFKNDLRETEMRLEARIGGLEIKIGTLETRMEAVKADILQRVFSLILGALIVNIVAMVGAVFAVAKLLAH